MNELAIISTIFSEAMHLLREFSGVFGQWSEEVVRWHIIESSMLTAVLLFIAFLFAVGYALSGSFVEDEDKAWVRLMFAACTAIVLMASLAEAAQIVKGFVCPSVIVADEIQKKLSHLE